MKVLYCHGFASGPSSAKGLAVRAHLRRRGVEVELLDLRVPSRTELRLSRMSEVVRDAIGDAPRAVAIGSSLGGLTVARAAERDPRIVATVLLAPAFRLVERWRARMGETDWAAWRSRGRFPFEDHTRESATIEVDFGFIEDASRVDQGYPAVTVPTTIIHGVRDETVEIELSRELAAARPDVRLIEVDDDHGLLASLDVITAEIDRTLDACADGRSEGRDR